MRPLIAFTLTLALAACGPEELPLSSQQQGLTKVQSFGSNPGGLAMYLYEPAGMPSAPAPVVVALHGCSQTAEDYVAAGWNGLADRLKFYVVYPQKTASLGCMGWSEPGNQVRGGPEPSSIKQMVDHLGTLHPVDASRVYVTGLSAGGAMTAVMLATYPDVFAAGASFAGVPFGCDVGCMVGPKARSAQGWGDLVRAAWPGYSGRRPRLAVWHGTADLLVPAVNLDVLVEQWTSVHGIDAVPEATSTVGAATRREHRSGDETRVESWMVDQLGHGTPVAAAQGCGQAAPYILDVGLCSTEHAARFFGLLAEVSPGVDAGAPGRDAEAFADATLAPDSTVGPQRDAGGAGSDAAADAGFPKLLPGRCGCAAGEGLSLPIALLPVLAARRRKT